MLFLGAIRCGIDPLRPLVPWLYGWEWVFLQSGPKTHPGTHLATSNVSATLCEEEPRWRKTEKGPEDVRMEEAVGSEKREKAERERERGAAERGEALIYSVRLLRPAEPWHLQQRASVAPNLDRVLQEQHVGAQEGGTSLPESSSCTLTSSSGLHILSPAVG